MNKRGQLDKAIEGLPVFLVIILISIAFVAIVAGVLGIKSMSDRNADVSSTFIPVIFEKISFKNESGQFNNLTLLEAFRKNGLSEEVKAGLNEIAPSNGCLYFGFKAIGSFTGSPQGMVLFRNKIMDQSELSDIVDDFTGKGANTYYKNAAVSNYTFYFVDQPVRTYYIETYSGRCLNEQ